MSEVKQDMLNALRNGEQMDIDGIMVKVSRQACVEGADLIEAQSALISELVEALEGIHGIIKESDGVAGYHLNGDVATWDGCLCDEVTDIEHALTKAKGVG